MIKTVCGNVRLDAQLIWIVEMSIFINKHIFSLFEAVDCVGNSSLKWMKNRKKTSARQGL